jgi:L-fuconolactonase
MPDFPIVDAHVHLWDPARFPIRWLEGNQRLHRRFDLSDYNNATHSVDIAAMVYVQVDVDTAYALLEARQVVEFAAMDPRLQAIVAWAPLEHGTYLRTYLPALTSLDPRIKGVRRVVQGAPDAEYSLRPGFIQGVRLLPEFDLTCDLCIVHSQLSSITELVRQCPETRFMLDHLGKPDIKTHQLDPWRAELAALAAQPNVTCKISGVVTEADHKHWTPADVAPYILHALDVFGEDRVAFGGDWPVVTEVATYERWIETLDGLTAHLSGAARRKLWSENARRFYRLPVAH